MRLSVVVVVFLVCGASPASAQAPALLPPVDGPVVVPFEPPSSNFGPGHRGIDYRVPEGTAVRAAGAGVVLFAGLVAGIQAVTIDHPGGLQTTYSQLGSIEVTAGTGVRTGQHIGRTGTAHASGEPGLHFGVKLEGSYVDPRDFMVAFDPGAAIRLAPVTTRDAGAAWDSLGIDVAGLPSSPRCGERWKLQHEPAPPNRNIAVAIAGINSSSTRADMFASPPQVLGYADENVYRFSYRGSDTRDFHQHYDKSDTWRDIRAAAGELDSLLRRIGRRHPGVPIDLIAHSQGGIVARAFLELFRDPLDRSLPPIAHLVTFSSPHEGAPLAGEALEIARGEGYMELLSGGLSRLARHPTLGLLPPPEARAIEQLAPGSELMTSLRTPETITGTRYMSIAIPEDPIVPATRTEIEGAVNVTAATEWSLLGHTAVLTSEQARAMAYDFLRDAAEPCRGSSENWGELVGAGLAAGSTILGEMLEAITGSLPGAGLADWATRMWDR